MLFCSLGKLTHVKAIVRDVSKVLIPKIVYLKALMRKKRPGTIANNRVSAYVYDGWCWRLSFTSVFFSCCFGGTLFEVFGNNYFFTRIQIRNS